MGYPRIGFAALLRRWRVPIALATVGGALLAYTYGTRVTPTYEANAQVLVEAPLASGGAAQAAELVPTYAEMVTSTPVLAFALRSTGVQTPLDELRANVRGEANQDTRLITIRADDTHRSDAVALANGLAAGLRWYVSVAPNPSSPGARVEPRPRVRLVDRATSAARVRPRSSLLLGFGALAGMFAALAVVLIAEARSPKVVDEDELAEIGAVPLLGAVNGASPGPSSVDPTRGSLEELASYRQLATRIAVANHEVAPRSLLVVGAEGVDGSSVVASKLALSLAHGGRRVVLAEFDERGRVGRFFRIGDESGREALVRRSQPVGRGSMTLDRFALCSGVPLVVVLPRFSTRGLSLEAAEDLVALLSADADLVILHGPPPGRSRGALTLARAAGTTLLVLRTEQTSRTNVRAAVEGLEPIGTNLVGAVLQTGRV